MWKSARQGVIAALALFALGACASPKVVQERQAGDQALTCAQLVDAIDEARGFENKARGERGATGTNVAAALLFWPALLATYSNSGDAIQAAQEREHYLTKLYDNKNCDQQVLAQRAQQAQAAQAAAATAANTAAPALTSTQSSGSSYTVASISGAGAYSEQMAQGSPLHTFNNGEKLTVIEASSDARWFKVMLPDGRTGYVASALVKAETATAAAAPSPDQSGENTAKPPAKKSGSKRKTAKADDSKMATPAKAE